MSTRRPTRAEHLSQAIDRTDQVMRPRRGFVIAADGSSYEASVSDGFPSARMGLLKIRTGLDRHGGVSQDRSAIRRGSGPNRHRKAGTREEHIFGAADRPGIHLDKLGPRESFRKSTFEAFRSARFELLDVGLETTLIDLLDLEGRTAVVNGRRHVVIPGNRKCPITGEPLGQDVLIPEDTGIAPCPRAPEQPLYTTDVLRLSEAFAEEGSNQQAYTRAMSVFEHLVLAHTIMRLDALKTYSGDP